jgi:hypothetical protein
MYMHSKEPSNSTSQRCLSATVLSPRTEHVMAPTVSRNIHVVHLQNVLRDNERPGTLRDAPAL